MVGHIGPLAPLCDIPKSNCAAVYLLSLQDVLTRALVFHLVSSPYEHIYLSSRLVSLMCNPDHQDPQDQHKGVRGAGAHVRPPAEHHLPRRAQDLPVLQREHQPGSSGAGEAATGTTVGEN